MPKTFKDKIKCPNCGREYVETNYYNSISEFFSKTKKIPYCKQCVKKFYDYFVDRYTNEGCEDPEKKAVRRICMAFDIHFNAKAYEECVRDAKTRKMDISPFSAYMKRAQLLPHKNKTYDDTINDEEAFSFTVNTSDVVSEDKTVDEKVIKFFGEGFTDQDYEFLQEQYSDWTTRHECETKAQEEVFKRICFKQLEILKATRCGEDTRHLDSTFRDLLDTAKLQPKQNKGETVSEAQTLGTLIDKLENTRPIPEVEEELKDVDKIGLLIHIFFTGHMAKVLNLPSSLSNLYNKFIKKYSVEKHIDSGEADNEVLFDKIFGKKNIDEPEV